MKNRIAPVLALCCLALALPVFAEEGSGQALNSEAQTKVKEELKALGQAFGVETPKPAESAKAAPAPSKTAAEVADKALGMVKDLVASVSKTLESVAPNVWRIMIRQQYANAIADLVLPWLLFVIALVIWGITQKKWVLKDCSSDDEKVARMIFAWIVPVACGAIFAIWGAIALSDSIKYLINPEYYAVRDLLTMLLNPSSVK